MFIDPQQFGFIAPLAARWREIRDECLALPETSFDPWVQREMYGQGWSVFGLIAFGAPIDAALAQCPRTAAAIAEVPGLSTAGFSRLAPGTRIQPHVGWVTTVYRAHLGLIVPPDCALRVGDETRAWREGEALVFDDTTLHEAWNDSDRTRTVLLFDFVRPGSEGAPADEPPPEVRELIHRRTAR
ncbi:MAG: aspartyl/asparaginyl beta-hydroxylase domain-containing protein [Kofleriaceae bacterium]